MLLWLFSFAAHLHNATLKKHHYPWFLQLSCLICKLTEDAVCSQCLRFSFSSAPCYASSNTASWQWLAIETASAEIITVFSSRSAVSFSHPSYCLQHCQLNASSRNTSLLVFPFASLITSISEDPFIPFLSQVQSLTSPRPSIGLLLHSPICERTHGQHFHTDLCARFSVPGGLFSQLKGQLVFFADIYPNADHLLQPILDGLTSETETITMIFGETNTVLLAFGLKALNLRGLTATLIPTQVGLVTAHLYSTEACAIGN